MLAPAAEARFGEDRLRALLLDSAARWPGFAEQLTGESGVEVGYRGEGTLLVAFGQDDLRALRRMCDYYQRCGLAVEMLSPTSVREREPLLSPRIHGGAFALHDHQVDPRRVLKALRVAADRLGVRFQASAVTDLSSLDAPTTVVAAGHASGALLGLPVRPVKGQVLRLRAPAAELRHVVHGFVFGRSVYLVPRQDGEVIVGATEEEQGADTTVTVGGVYELLRAATELVPELTEYVLTETLAGLRPATPDNAPLLGWLREGVAVATGHFRNGVLLTPVTADAIAELVTTGQVPAEIAAFAPQRFLAAQVGETT
jgi:glycine oxidase